MEWGEGGIAGDSEGGSVRRHAAQRGAAITLPFHLGDRSSDKCWAISVRGINIAILVIIIDCASSFLLLGFIHSSPFPSLVRWSSLGVSVSAPRSLPPVLVCYHSLAFIISRFPLFSFFAFGFFFSGIHASLSFCSLLAFLSLWVFYGYFIH
jgi:hypothetical protein